MLRPYIAHDDVAVRRHRFPEDPASPVSRALGVRARRRLEVVDEALHDATFYEARGPGWDTLIVHGTRRGATHAERVVGEREPGVEHLLPDLRPQGGNALQHRLSGEGLRHREHQSRQP